MGAGAGKGDLGALDKSEAEEGRWKARGDRGKRGGGGGGGGGEGWRGGDRGQRGGQDGRGGGGPRGKGGGGEGAGERVREVPPGTPDVQWVGFDLPLP